MPNIMDIYLLRSSSIQSRLRTCFHRGNFGLGNILDFIKHKAHISLKEKKSGIVDKYFKMILGIDDIFFNHI